MRNGLPPRPARNCEKIAGPELSSLIARAIRAIAGAKATSKSDAPAISKARLRARVERERSQVSQSTTATSATWTSCWPGPPEPAIGDTTHPFTQYRRDLGGSESPP